METYLILTKVHFMSKHRSISKRNFRDVIIRKKFLIGFADPRLTLSAVGLRLLEDHSSLPIMMHVFVTYLCVAHLYLIHISL
jgi:hypothetical protein